MSNQNEIISNFIQTQKAIGRSITNELGYAALILSNQPFQILTTKELKALAKELRAQF